MKKKALVMTVGTGLGGTDDSATRLAKGLIASVEHNNPDFIVFCVTKESKEQMIPVIKNQCSDLPRNECYMLNDPNRVAAIYAKLVDRIKTLKTNDFMVTVDFTSGTKAMSAGAVLAGVAESCRLSYIAGERGENNVVIQGMEEVLTMEPVQMIIDREEEKIRYLFNRYHYASGLYIADVVNDLTSSAVITERFDRYRTLLQGYSKWDQFDHEGAWELLKFFDNSLVNIDQNKKFLGKLNSSDLKEEWLIPDLLNNAFRRIEEQRFDDAVARLYRCIEMIAQYVLKKSYGLDPSGILLDDIRDKISCDAISYYEQRADENGRIQLPLKGCYQLLNDLDDEHLQGVLDDHSLRDLLYKRNSSILAHGIMVVDEKNAKRLYEKTKDVAGKVIKDLDEKMCLARFPKL